MTIADGPIRLRSPTEALNPIRSARSRTRRARSGLRTRKSTCAIPRSRQATSAEAAVAPAPRIVARPAPAPPAPAGPESLCGAIARTMPRTSVLATCTRPLRRMRVLPAAVSTAVSSTSHPRTAASVTRRSFNGIVSENPMCSGWESRNPSSSSEPSSNREYSLVSMCSAAKAARWSSGDFECAIGEPSTAARILTGYPLSFLCSRSHLR